MGAVAFGLSIQGKYAGLAITGVLIRIIGVIVSG